jgi:pyrrolidone-carboxylate peptidase
MKVGFVHIPVLPEQVIKYWPEAPFMSMDMLREALSLIIASNL